MTQVRAYLMSFIGLQLVTGRDKFSQRFPHAWLVWEPGAWHVPQAAGHRTQLPTHANAPGKGDALCFELKVDAGRPITIGRTETHPLVVNDATFSRDQLILTHGIDGSWTVAAVLGAQPATLDGGPLLAKPVPLRSNATLKAGDVTLRFYEPFDFVARVDTEIKSGKI